MIYNADSELATNGCWSLGTTGELRTFRGFAHSGSLTQVIIPPAAETATSQTVLPPTFHAQMRARRSPW